jgi:hypothetical protein
MAAQKREVRIYQTEEGKTPYKSWFNGLRNLKTKAKIDARINRIRLGHFGDCSTVGGEFPRSGWTMAQDIGFILVNGTVS